MRLLCIFSLILLTFVNLPEAIAQDGSGQQETESAQRRPRRQPDGQRSDETLQQPAPRFRGRMVVLEIDARVVGQNETVTWSESHRKETLLGRPVGIKLVGNNIIVDVQFTPYFRPGARYYLVAQAQIWMEIPGQGMRYYTAMQTIPVEFGELIYFFPLGPRGDDDNSHIEITLTVQPYEE